MHSTTDAVALDPVQSLLFYTDIFFLLDDSDGFEGGDPERYRNTRTYF
jgi:hypothetical protein